MYQKLWKFGITLPEVQAFFVLNVASISKENEKLVKIICGSLTYTCIKVTLKKAFVNISSSKYNTVPAIKEEMEMVNFNWYSNNRGQKKKKNYQGSYCGNKSNPTDKQGLPLFLSDIFVNKLYSHQQN